MLILASQSPRRRSLLARITEEFIVRPSGCDEHTDERDPAKRVSELARRKARAVEANADDLVLASDTVVALDGEILEKPADAEDARRMLRLLSGRTHTVFTGVCLRRGETEDVFFCRTEVTFWPLEGALIEDYIASGEPMDKAGAYGIQGRGALLVRSIEGDFFNVMGLPIGEVYRRLQRLHVGR